MQLGHAWICIDCDEVFQPIYPKRLTCPRCGSKQTAMLRKWVMPMSNLEELNKCSEKTESGRAA